MGRFKAFFSRSKKNTQTQTFRDEKTSVPPQSDTSQECGVDIAALPAAGMQRSLQAPYILSHATSTPSRTSTNVSSSSNTTFSSHTAVDKNFVSQHGESHWQGKPQGKAYDKREELSAEDEEMWAKMAM